jgi:hypothetical protein
VIYRGGDPSKRVGLIEKMYALRRQVSLPAVTINSTYPVLKTVTPEN